VLSFAQHAGKGREGVGVPGGVLVAGEKTNERLSAWLRAAAATAHQSSEPLRARAGRERHSERTWTREGCSGRKGGVWFMEIKIGIGKRGMG
jgi:hypothetical protein